MTRVLLVGLLLLAACATPAVQGPAASGGAIAEQPGTVGAAPEGRASAVLDALLQDEEAEVRNEALVALGLSSRKDALEKLQAALDSKDGNQRFSAARGLRHLANPAAVDALGQAWLKEKGWAVKKELALAASTSDGRHMIPLLEEALADPNQDLRHAAAWALESLGSAKGTAALDKLGRPEPRWSARPGTERWSRSVLADAREGDKLLALRTLAELGTAEDVELASRYLDAPQPLLRLFAAALVLRQAR